jgi:hypothetical protein
MRVIAAGRELLERLGEHHGLDGLLEIHNMQETGKAGPAPEQQAFALMSFGLPIYREMGHAKYFPARTRSARRRGARGVRASLRTSEGERAVIFMTHAVPAFAVAFWQCQARQGEIDDAAPYEHYHGSVRSLLQRYHPLSNEDERALADARRDVDVFETRTPVSERGLPARTGYAIGLMEGRNPDEDPRLVESHVGHALHVFRIKAQNHALRVGLDSAVYESVEPQLLSPWDLGSEALAWRASIDSYWTDVVGDYFEFVRPRAET